MKRNCWFPNTLGRDDSNKPKVGMSSAPEAKGHEPRRTSMKSQQADSLRREQNRGLFILETATAAKSLQSCPTLCDPIDGSPPGSSVPGILQARTLEWVAISFSNAGKWKVKVKSLSHVRLLATPWTAATRLPRPWDSPGKSTGVGCHYLLQCMHWRLRCIQSQRDSLHTHQYSLESYVSPMERHKLMTFIRDTIWICSLTLQNHQEIEHPWWLADSQCMILTKGRLPTPILQHTVLMLTRHNLFNQYN